MRSISENIKVFHETSWNSYTTQDSNFGFPAILISNNNKSRYIQKKIKICIYLNEVLKRLLNTLFYSIGSYFYKTNNLK